jgi:hypothetical protein
MNVMAILMMMMSLSLNQVESLRGSLQKISRTSLPSTGLSHVFGTLTEELSSAFSFSKRLQMRIQSSSIEEVNPEQYVRRTALEENIGPLKGVAPNGEYTIVYGPSGSGKSSLVDHIYAGQKSVVKLVTTSATRRDQIIAQLTKQLLGRRAPRNVTSDDFIKAVRGCSIVPTFIFDVDCGGAPEDAWGRQAVRSIVKQLAQHCRCTIILSDTNAVLEFGRDRARERFCYVDDMAKDEAVELLGRLGSTFTSAECDYIFDTIGGNPMVLNQLATAVKRSITVEEFVDAKIADAELDLNGFPVQDMLAELKQRPEGVSPLQLRDKESQGVPLSDRAAVGSAMKKSNAVVYRMESRAYTLMSTAHRTAIKSYTPIYPIVPSRHP